MGIILVILLLIGLAVFAYMRIDNVEPEPQACTMEAKICPDGTTVGRTGPNCQFAACPGILSTTTASGVSYDYSPRLSTQYITAVDWPPMVQVSDSPFVCTEAGSATDRAGETRLASIGARSYCITRVVEGAAGNVYTQYAYTTLVDTKVVTLTFSTRQPQCENYAEPQRTACQNEQESFDINAIVDQIVNTMRMS